MLWKVKGARRKAKRKPGNNTEVVPEKHGLTLYIVPWRRGSPDIWPRSHGGVQNPEAYAVNTILELVLLALEPITMAS